MSYNKRIASMLVVSVFIYAISLVGFFVCSFVNMSPDNTGLLVFLSLIFNIYSVASIAVLWNGIE